MVFLQQFFVGKYFRNRAVGDHGAFFDYNAAMTDIHDQVKIVWGDYFQMLEGLARGRVCRWPLQNQWWHLSGENDFQGSIFMAWRFWFNDYLHVTAKNIKKIY